MMRLIWLCWVEMNGVISVFHSDTQSMPQTTRSWDFISLLEADWDPTKVNGGEELLRKASYGKNVIVGLLDTGNCPFFTLDFLLFILHFINIFEM